MTFASRKDILYYATIIPTLGLLFGICIQLILKGDWIVFGILILASAYLVWILTAVKYQLETSHLHYFVGPHKGKIAISSIREIVKGKTMWSGLKPATAKKGLIIKYHKYDEIYISPSSNELFIQEILKYNSNIKILE